MRVPVVHIITKLELGGAQQNTLYTVGHLDRRRFRPYLITGKGGVLDPEAGSLKDVPVYFLSTLVREVRPWRDALALWRIRRALRRIRLSNPGAPLIVHTHSSKAGILGRWAAWMEEVPIVLHTFHGFGFHRDQWAPLKGSFRALEKWTSRVTTHFITVSRANTDEAIRSGFAPAERFTLIRSGIDLKSFEGLEVNREHHRAELGIENEDLVVTMVGCLKPQKAPLDFVRVAEVVSGAHPRSMFMLVGDGSLRPKVERMVRSVGLGSRFRLMGWRRDVPRILSASDVMVLTSRWEGLPRAIPEAMAAGLPVVATRVDGIPEAVSNGVTGYLLEPGDVLGLARRTIELLEAPALRLRMGNEARKRVSPFDIAGMVPRQEALYEKLLARWAYENGISNPLEGYEGGTPGVSHPVEGAHVGG